MTFSINTNNAAMAALESLSKTQSALNSTENAVSTGLKVSSASDNPAIYAISSTMNANIAGLSAVSDSLSFGSSVLSTSSSAASSIISTLTTLQNQVTTAGTTGISTSTMQTAIANALNDINTYARQSTFNGVNLLTSMSDANSGGTSAVTSSAMQVVDSLNGGTIGVSNQLTGGANTLTTELGLTGTMAAGATVISTGTAGTGQVTQNLLSNSGAAGGLNISLSSALASASFSSNSNVVLHNADGSTTTFEFVASGTSTTTANTTGANANTTVAVTINSGSETSNQMMGDLVNAMNSHGYNAVVQNDGSVDVTGQGVASSTSTVSGVNAGTTLSSSEALITTIQSAIGKMTSIATGLGYASQQIKGLQSFTSDLSDAMTSGVGALVDADLSEESAKLTSLQTKQQLAIQSLSIANSQSQSILSLFR